jgi:integrase
MPRRPKPWYKKSHDAWYVKIKGKLVRLGATEADAWKEFHRLMADGDAGAVRKAVPGGRVLLGDVLDAWIEAKRVEVKPKTLDMMRMFAQSLLVFAPRMKAADVRPTTLADWVASHPGWGQTTRSIAIRRIKSAFRWAEDEELIARNPIAKVKAPPDRVRPPADPTVVELVMGDISEQAREVLTFMYLTGARPGEAISVEASGVDFAKGTARVTGKMGARVLVVPSDYLPELRRLAATRPTGPLFRSRAGNPWTPSAIQKQIARAKERLGLTGSFAAYHLRGIFATERIAAGVGDSLVGKMLGHSKPFILHKHYHNPDLSTLREAVDRKPEPDAPRKKKPR